MKFEKFLRLSDYCTELMGVSVITLALMTVTVIALGELKIQSNISGAIISILAFVAIISALGSFLLSQLMLIVCDKVKK